MNNIVLKNGRKVPLIGFGTWKLNGQQAVSAVHTALDLGYRHIDTAAMYGNEHEVGKAIGKALVDRDELFITSKVWPDSFHRKDFIRSVENSLKALKTDYIDLILLHWPSSDISLHEPLDALGNLIAEGKVLTGGVSNFDPYALQAALSYAPEVISLNQIKMAYPSIPDDVIRVAHDNAVAITAYSPLNAGSMRSDPLVQRLAVEYAKTPAQITLRWLTQQNIIAIPKSSSFHRMNENLSSLDFTLSDEAISALGII